MGEATEADAGRQDGLTTQEREELAQLGRENRRPREDVEILKRKQLFCVESAITALTLRRLVDLGGETRGHCGPLPLLRDERESA